MKVKGKKLRLGLVIAALFLGACSENSANVEQSKKDSSFAEMTVNHSLHDLMVMGIDPQADVLWEASATVIDENGEHDLAPVTEEGWLLTQSAAIMLAQMGNILQLPAYADGKGQDWVALSSGLTQASLNAEQAVISKDKQAIIETGVIVYNVCKACHELYLDEDEQ